MKSYSKYLVSIFLVLLLVACKQAPQNIENSNNASTDSPANIAKEDQTTEPESKGFLTGVFGSKSKDYVETETIQWFNPNFLSTGNIVLSYDGDNNTIVLKSSQEGGVNVYINLGDKDEYDAQVYSFNEEKQKWQYADRAFAAAYTAIEYDPYRQSSDDVSKTIMELGNDKLVGQSISCSSGSCDIYMQGDLELSNEIKSHLQDGVTEKSFIGLNDLVKKSENPFTIIYVDTKTNKMIQRTNRTPSLVQNYTYDYDTPVDIPTIKENDILPADNSWAEEIEKYKKN